MTDQHWDCTEVPLSAVRHPMLDLEASDVQEAGAFQGTSRQVLPSLEPGGEHRRRAVGSDHIVQAPPLPGSMKSVCTPRPSQPSPHALVVHLSAFDAQQVRDPTISVATEPARQPHHVCA